MLILVFYYFVPLLSHLLTNKERSAFKMAKHNVFGKTPWLSEHKAV